MGGRCTERASGAGGHTSAAQFSAAMNGPGVQLWFFSEYPAGMDSTRSSWNGETPVYVTKRSKSGLTKTLGSSCSSVPASPGGGGATACSCAVTHSALSCSSSVCTTWNHAGTPSQPYTSGSTSSRSRVAVRSSGVTCQARLSVSRMPEKAPHTSAYSVAYSVAVSMTQGEKRWPERSYFLLA